MGTSARRRCRCGWGREVRVGRRRDGSRGNLPRERRGKGEAGDGRGEAGDEAGDEAKGEDGASLWRCGENRRLPLRLGDGAAALADGGVATCGADGTVRGWDPRRARAPGGSTRAAPRWRVSASGSSPRVATASPSRPRAARREGVPVEGRRAEVAAPRQAHRRRPGRPRDVPVRDPPAVAGREGRVLVRRDGFRTRLESSAESRTRSTSAAPSPRAGRARISSSSPGPTPRWRWSSRRREAPPGTRRTRGP